MITPKSILKALAFLDITSTYIVPLDADDDVNDWAIVFGYVYESDYKDSIPRINGKVAYLPKNSLMREYDIDWTMPYNESGDVDDTELTIGDEKDIEWLYEQWERIKKENNL